MSTGQTIRIVGARQRAFAHQLLDKAPIGAIVNIKEATRTIEQNAKMHAMLSDIARAKPDGRVHTTDQWKAIMMAACGFKADFVPDADGTGFICTGFRSSRLRKAQFSELIECMYEFGARHGVAWSEPMERAA